MRRVVDLRAVPAAVRFVSAEPLLGPLPSLNLDGVDWVIAGGESGYRARPVDATWVRDLRDACASAGVAFFFKQWGGRTPRAGGRQLEGRTWDDMPRPRRRSPPGDESRRRIPNLQATVSSHWTEPSPWLSDPGASGPRANSTCFRHICPRSPRRGGRQPIEGSLIRALQTNPPFTVLRGFELRPARARSLQDALRSSFPNRGPVADPHPGPASGPGRRSCRSARSVRSGLPRPRQTGGLATGNDGLATAVPAAKRTA